MHLAFNKEMDTCDVLFPSDSIVAIQLTDIPRSAEEASTLQYIEEVIDGKLSRVWEEGCILTCQTSEAKTLSFALLFFLWRWQNDTIQAISTYWYSRSGGLGVRTSDSLKPQAHTKILSTASLGEMRMRSTESSKNIAEAENESGLDLDLDRVVQAQKLFSFSILISGCIGYIAE